MSLRVMTQGGGTGGASASIFVTGLDSTSTVTAAKDGKTVRGKWVREVNPAWRGLPDGYTQLSHIEATGTQYLIPNIYPAVGLKTVCRYTPTDLNTDNHVLSMRTSTFELFAAWQSSTLGVGFAFGVRNSTVKRAAYSSLTVIEQETIVYDTYAKSYFNGVEFANSSGTVPSNAPPMYLLGMNNEGVAGYFCKAKLEYVYAEISGTKTHELVSAKRNADGVLGMYDIVTGEFLTNQGTGSFIAGEEIPQYIYCHEITIKEYGMWTVTATDGEKTKTQDVLVDAAVEYEIELSYVPNYVMIYDGDFGESGASGENTCTEITGGFNVNDVTCNANYSTIEGTPGFNTSDVFVGYTGNGSSNRVQSISAKQQIDLSGYVGFALDMNFGTTLYGGSSCVGFATNKSYAANNVVADVSSPVNEFKRRIYTRAVSYSHKAWFYAFAIRRHDYYSNVRLYHAWLYKADDITTLCSKAEISAPADIETLIADTASITDILSNKSAVDFMVSNCTGDFMAAFISSSDCLSALNASPYKSIVLANKHWKKFLAMVGVTA